MSPTLVVFLHGVIKPNSGWQHAQQRAVARAAERYQFFVLMPRGRRGVGPKGMEDWWTWPTAVKHQERVESDLLSEWGAARWLLERRTNTRFSRVLVFGFSNGAYYASQLALRDAFSADGYALFAGGSGAPWLEKRGSRATRHPPIFLGFGSRDRTARDDGRKLTRALKRLGWPHRSIERPGGGHTISDALMAQAARYLELK
jgi:predicted esterase